MGIVQYEKDDGAYVHVRSDMGMGEGASGVIEGTSTMATKTTGALLDGLRLGLLHLRTTSPVSRINCCGFE